MQDLLKLEIDNTMSVYKTAFEEGRKIGYLQGKSDAWKEANQQLDKILNQARKLVED